MLGALMRRLAIYVRCHKTGGLLQCLFLTTHRSFIDQSRNRYDTPGRPGDQHLESASRDVPPQTLVNAVSNTPHAPQEVARVGLTAPAACTPFG
jgi:hypothetical protein